MAGTSSLRRLGSLIYSAALIAILYFIPAMNLAKRKLDQWNKK